MTDIQLNQIDFTPQFQTAWDLMEHSKQHLFITGKAGTGKSTLLDYFREHTQKDIAILAPTGVAAVNVEGQTIHSFFRFGINIAPAHIFRLDDDDRKLYENLDTIVIDEISMVRADLLDYIDIFLRRNGPDKNQPFGGIQMIFIGDLAQLPPVLTDEETELFAKDYLSPYFFDSNVITSKVTPLYPFQMILIELDKIFRQTDPVFINLLNAIRDNAATDQHLATLNQHYTPYFTPGINDLYVYLATTNNIVDSINIQTLAQIKQTPFYNTGEVLGHFPDKSLPADKELVLKEGAQVMFTNNERDEDGNLIWVNGTMGIITAITSKLITVETADGSRYGVSQHTWKNWEKYFNEYTKEVDRKEVGSYTQFPLKLAWAATIHKSQGKTFDKVVIDVGRGTFVHGQMYVALSRCTSLDGIVLAKPIKQRHILFDPRITAFMTEMKEIQAKDKLT